MPVTRKELADILGVDIRTVTNLAKEGMPKEARGKFDLGVCVKYYVEREREAARSGRGLNDLDLARQRKTIAEARMAEIELDALEGNMIPLEVHEQRIEGVAGRLAAQCKGLDRFIAPVQRATTAAESKAVLDSVSDALLASLRAVADDLETIEVVMPDVDRVSA